MTLIGVWSKDPDTAFAWADTESFWREDGGRFGLSLGHVLKLAINQQANIAAVGAGDAGGNRRIAEAVAIADSLDDLTIGLPVYLRGEARDRLDSVGEWPDWICIAAGWSHRLRRVLAVVFNAETEFVPSLTPGFSMPAAGTPDVNAPDDVVSIAQQQMHVLRKSNPLAGAGTLTVAEIRRDRITMTPFDIPTGASLSALPIDVEAMSAPPSRLLKKSFCEGLGV